MSAIDVRLQVKRILSALILLLMGAAAHAQTLDQSLRRCEGTDADVAIAACTAAIQSGNLPVRALAAVYSNRGGAHMNKQAYDLAITDFDQAIMLDPGNATNVHNRGFAFETIGRLDNAIRD
jgi:tetratricopeptide (TPR) repeat protein